MANATGKQKTSRQITVLMALLLLGAGVWGFYFWQERQQAPVRERIAEGRRLLEQGQSAAAESHWREAARLDPGNGEAWALLGEYYLAVRNWPRAQEAYQQLAQLAPETPQVWGRLAVAAGSAEDMATAQRASEEALKRDANDVDALRVKAVLLTRADDNDALLEVLRRLEKLQPDNFDHKARLADLLTQKTRFDEARPLLQWLIKQDSNFGPAYSMRAEGLLRPGASERDLKQAGRDLRRALSFDPQHEQAHYLLAQVYTRQKQWDNAIAQYQRLLQLNGQSTTYWTELAGAYQASGNKAQAIATRQRVAQVAAARDRRNTLESRVANNPDSFEDNLELGLLLLRGENPLHADKYITKALALKPKDARAEAAARELESKYLRHLNAGLHALKTGDLKRMDKEISRAMLLRPKDPRTVRAVQMATEAATKSAPKTAAQSQVHSAP